MDKTTVEYKDFVNDCEEALQMFQGTAPAGFKADKGKNRVSLVIGSMARAMEEIGRVATFGANKYSADGWIHVDSGQERYKDALLRHLLADFRGETKDQESGLMHLAHCAWCAIAVLDLKLRELEQKNAT